MSDYTPVDLGRDGYMSSKLRLSSNGGSAAIREMQKDRSVGPNNRGLTPLAQERSVRNSEDSEKGIKH